MITGLPVDKWIALFLTLTGFPFSPPTGSVERAVSFDQKPIFSQTLPLVEKPLAVGVASRLEEERNAYLASARSA